MDLEGVRCPWSVVRCTLDEDLVKANSVPMTLSKPEVQVTAGVFSRRVLSVLCGSIFLYHYGHKGHSGLVVDVIAEQTTDNRQRTTDIFKMLHLLFALAGFAFGLAPEPTKMILNGPWPWT